MVCELNLNKEVKKKKKVALARAFSLYIIKEQKYYRNRIF